MRGPAACQLRAHRARGPRPAARGDPGRRGLAVPALRHVRARAAHRQRAGRRRATGAPGRRAAQRADPAGLRGGTVPARDPVRVHRLRHLAVQVFAAVRRARVQPGVPRGQVAAARARLQHRPVRPGRPDPAHVHPGPAHADLAGPRRGRLHRGGVPGSDRAVGTAPLGRVLRLRGHVSGHPVRAVRAGRQGHHAAADRVPDQRGAARLPGAVQAAARRPRRQDGLRRAAAQRIDHAGGDRRGRRPAAGGAADAGAAAAEPVPGGSPAPAGDGAVPDPAPARPPPPAPAGDGAVPDPAPGPAPAAAPAEAGQASSPPR